MPETPEDRGLVACHRVRELTPTAVLKFSAGKDSVACWLRLREIFPRVVPVFHYWVPGLEFVERSLALYEDFFKTPIYRMPHPNFLNFIANGSFQPPHRWNVIEAYNLDTVDYDEIVDWACEDMGLDDYWVAVGIKTSDSPLRAAAIAKNGAWTPNKKLFYPVADLNKAALVELLRLHRAPLSQDYSVFGRSFDGFQWRYLHKIKEIYPRDYARILEWFPLAEAEFARKAAFDSQTGAGGRKGLK